MNASIGYLGLGMMVLFFVTMIFLRESNKNIAELKKELKKELECIDYLRRYSQLISEELDHAKEVWDDVIAKNEKEVNDLKKNTYVASHLKGIESSLKGILDIVEQEHADSVKWRSEAAERQIKAFCEHSDASEDTGDDGEPYADIPGDLDDGFEGEESITEEQKKEAPLRPLLELPIPVYTWMFPTEPGFKVAPIVGTEYLVIGRDKSMHESSDTNVDIVSGIGTWKGFHVGRGYCGFDMEDGYQLDKVYAFIQLPSPSDVMNEVLDIRFKEG